MAEMDELKELVRHNIKVAEDTNRLLHSMRRSQRMRTLLGFLWWIIILGVSGYTYYYFLAPYIGEFSQVYNQAQQTLKSFHPAQ
jgi:uncharacterized membrane protein